jgi:Tfp pilus assembly protein PilN
MNSVFGNVCLGISIADDTIHLAVVSKRFSKVEARGVLSLVDWKTRPLSELKTNVSEFFKTHRFADRRGTLVVSRQNTVMRQFSVPVGTQVNLAKVVEYQIVNFLPSEDATVVYDFTAVRESAGTALQVTVFMVSKVVLEQELQLCQNLGINVDRVVPSGIALANSLAVLGDLFQSKNALFIRFENGHYEAMGISGRQLSVWRTGTSSQEEGSLLELLRTEVDYLRSRANLGSDAPLDVWLAGRAGKAIDISPEALQVQHLGDMQQKTFGLDFTPNALATQKVQDHLFSLVAGIGSLQKKVPAPLNLLPEEKRRPKESWQTYLLYGLVAANCLLIAALILRGKMQAAHYSGELAGEVARLEPEVRKVRSSEDQLEQLHQKRDRLASLKSQNKVVLEALLEMSLILPKHTVMTDLSFKEGSMEISGFSAEAAALPQIIDSSGYFKEVEFLSAITRSSVSADKESFRLRMKLERQPNGLAGTPSIAANAPIAGTSGAVVQEKKR